MAENKMMRVIMLHTKRNTNTGKCKDTDTLGLKSTSQQPRREVPPAVEICRNQVIEEVCIIFSSKSINTTI